jgi:DNA-binding NtrC family response regulator
MQSLCDYSWPGNVRQLENVVEQAVVMNADSECLSASDFCLPSGVRTERSAPVNTPVSPISVPKSNLPEEGVDFTALLRQFERGILDQALMKAQGNKTLAAEMLGLPRTTLVNKLRALESAA